MASNVGRWLKYAKAKLDDTLGSAHKELDELEAEREARTADKPWLTAEGDAPTLDEVRAKIEARSASASAPVMSDVATTPDGEPVRPSSWDGPAAPPEAAPSGAAPTDAGAAGSPSGSADDDLRSVAEAAAQSQAKLELETRAREAAERLDQIRRELGVDTPPDSAP